MSYVVCAVLELQVLTTPDEPARSELAARSSSFSSRLNREPSGRQHLTENGRAHPRGVGHTGQVNHDPILPARRRSEPKQ